MVIICHYNSYLAQPAKPLDLWEKYKEVMGEDISQNFPLAHTMCNAEKQRCLMNEVLLCLQEELEGIGSSLELFGLLTPNLEFHVERVPKKQYQKKCFVLKTKQILAEENREQLNMDQAHAFSAIMEAVT